MIDKEAWYRTSGLTDEAVRLLRLFADDAISARELKDFSQRLFQEGSSGDITPLLERGKDGYMYITKRWHDLNGGLVKEIISLAREVTNTAKEILLSPESVAHPLRDSMRAYFDIAFTRGTIWQRARSEWLVPGKRAVTNHYITHRDVWVSNPDETYLNSEEELESYLKDSKAHLESLLRSFKEELT